MWPRPAAPGPHDTLAPRYLPRGPRRRHGLRGGQHHRRGGGGKKAPPAPHAPPPPAPPPPPPPAPAPRGRAGPAPPPRLARLFPGSSTTPAVASISPAGQ